MTFCLAVGLSCGVSPSDAYEGWGDVIKAIGDVFLATASMAVAIGLIQQAILLFRSSKFGRQFYFEMGWRCVIASILILCLLIEMLVGTGYITLPEWQGSGWMDYGVASPRLILFGCMIVVLAEYRHRLLPVSRNAPGSFWRFAISLGVGFLFLLLILIDQTLVHRLVYMSLESIELCQPLFFQRHGAYPNHYADGYWFFWLSTLATTSLSLGVTVWLWLLCYWKNSPNQRFAIVFVVACLGFSSWYGIWYYAKGLLQISPEMIEAGFQSNWPDWVGAGGLLTFFITVGAVRIARKEINSLSIPIESIPYRTAFHESWLLLGLIFSATIVINTPEFMLNLSTSYGWYYDLLGKVYGIGSYLPLAISLLSLQILWLRWKNRSKPQSVGCSRINWRKFGVAWISLALMFVIGVPVIAAFSISFWLGPWYLL